MSRTVKIGTTEITWDQAGNSVNFLDMRIWLGAGNELHTQPFVKAMSHLERIPWASHHPVDVKRGTLIGELTRAATLCNHLDAYKTAVKDLALLYTARGYPPNLVHSWIKRYGSERWHNRLTDREEDVGDVLALKSTYNPVWKFVQASELQAEFTRAAVSARALAIGKRKRSDHPEGADASSKSKAEEFIDSLVKSRVLVSRKRTRNLWDLTRMWNKTQIEVFQFLVDDEGTDLASDWN